MTSLNDFPAPTVPRVTVIVTAFDRREFLEESVDSVLRSTIRSTDYELCIVSNFPVAGLQLPAPSSRVTYLHPEFQEEGRWVTEAAKRTRGAYVCFLDDDDLFEPEKLETVASIFDTYPTVGFIRNGLKVVTADGRTTAALLGGTPLAAPAEFVPEGSKTRATIDRLWKRGGAFNNSSMSIRRSLLTELASGLERIRGGYGAFLFYGALASESTLRFDSMPLTRFRIHSRNQSPEATPSNSERREREMRLAAVRASDADELLRFVLDRKPNLWTGPLRHARARSRVISDLASSSRSGRLEGFRELMMNSSPREMWSDRDIWVFAASRLLTGAPAAPHVGGGEKAASAREPGP